MRRLIALLTLAPLAACGYGFQNSQPDLPLQKAGVRRVYVAPVVNSTYRPGVENVVYNALVRAISAGRRVKLVSRAEDADAVLKGAVGAASYAASAATTANNVFPLNTGPTDITVATEYQAYLICDFQLVHQHPVERVTPTLWASSFARNKAFRGNNQLGIFGTTSALINDSEFDRALRDLAESMMADLHESMLAMF